MKTSFRKILAGLLAAGAALSQTNFVFSEEAASSPAIPETVMYLYNHDCEDLTLGSAVGVGAYLSSTYNTMNRVVAAPESDASNGKSIKVTAAEGQTQFYKIFTGEKTYYDGEEIENPAEYNNEVVLSFDVFCEAGTRTPNFTIQHNKMNNMTLASAFIDKDGKLSVATSSEIKSMPQETATDSGYFVYGPALEADKWHNITIVYNKDQEKTTWFADGAYVCDAVFPTKNATYESKKGFRYFMQCFALVNEGLAASAYIDNIKIAYAKPAAAMEIQTELYYNDTIRGVTVTGPASASTTFTFDSVKEVNKDYIVEFNLKPDTLTAKGACIVLQNAAGNALATGFMANTEGSLVVRTESTASPAIGAPASTISGYTQTSQVSLKNAKLVHVRDAFRKDAYTNFKLYVNIEEKCVYYYVNDVYIAKTAATDYSLLPAKMVFTYPTNNGASTGGKFWVNGMKVGYTEPSLVSVEGLDVVDANGYTLNGAEVFADDAAEAYVKAAVNNGTPEEVNLLIVIAQYNGNQMIDTKVVNKTVAAGEKYTTDQNAAEACKLTISPDATSIKAFVWDAGGLLTPYCSSAEAIPVIIG